MHAIYDNIVPIQNDRSSRTETADGTTDETKLNSYTADTPPHMSMLVASVPFTTSANHKYDLEERIQVISKSSPDLVVLTRPFLDAKHEQITEKSDAAYSGIFETRVLSRLKSLLSEIFSSRKSESHITVIPSLGYVHHDFVCRWQD